MAQMITLIQSLKARYHLKTIAVSNEWREINAYRIRIFGLDRLIDTFVSSCFVHYRKPDPDIFHIALDISHSNPEQVAYRDDKPLFIEVANRIGIHGIIHVDLATSNLKLTPLGLSEQLS